jgi:signal transduction histidine kinase
LIGRLLDWVEGWSYRLYRLEPARLSREEGLRAELLRRLLRATSVAIVLFFLGGLFGLVATAHLIWITVEILVTIAICYWLLHCRRGFTATTLFVTVLSHPASFLLSENGIGSPAGALFLPSILACGLLMGEYFLWTWTAICCSLLFLIPIYKAGWAWGPIIVLLPAIFFWWLMCITVGWLVYLFSAHLERLLQLGRGQAHALNLTLALMVKEPPLEGMVGRVLRVIEDEMGGSIQLWTLNSAAGLLQCSSTSSLETGATTAPTPIPAESFPIWQLLLDTRRTIRVTKPSDDPRVSDWPDICGAPDRDMLFVPVPAGSDITGFMLLRLKPAATAHGELELAETLALQLGLFLQIRHLARTERHAVVVEERNRMAREIHDSLAQGFTGVVVQLNAAEQALSLQPEAVPKHINTARELARSNLDEARRSVWALRPLALEERGLVGALEKFAHQLSADSRIRAEVTATGQEYPLSPEIESDLARIGQEAMTNAVRHARASRLLIRLDYCNGRLRMEVEDDGIGGVIGNTGQADATGFGLVGMRDRIARLGGLFRIDSPPGSGTRIVVELRTG